jgi:hypothetical protein
MSVGGVAVVVVVEEEVEVLVQHQDGNDAVDGRQEGRTRVRCRCTIQSKTYQHNTIGT